MALANEYVAKAKGWEQFELPDNNSKEGQDRLDFSHKVAKLFSSTEGKDVLDVWVRQFLLNDIVSPNDSLQNMGIKQGHASFVKKILAHIEISDNSK